MLCARSDKIAQKLCEIDADNQIDRQTDINRPNIHIN